MPDKPIVVFDNVSFAYDGGQKEALSGVDLRIFQGEFLCILGSNGSGKTTLAKMVNGLLVPKAGKVVTCSLDTSVQENLIKIRQRAGMVFQNPDDQLIGNSIEDDVAFGPENLCLPSIEIKERVDQSLKSVGLFDFSQHETRTLSGGQKQRVAIAAALAMKPEILILDEAGSMLDPRGRKDLMKACKKLNRDGLTIIYVTHFLSEAAQADRVLVMDEGKIVEDGRAKEILENGKMLRSLNLDAPFCVRLCHELADIGVKVGMHLEDAGLIDAINRLGFSSKLADEKLAEDGPAFEACAETSETLMRLDDVSYSYMDKHSLKKVLKSRRRQYEAEKNKSDKNKSIDAKKLKWGVEPESIWAIQDLSLELHEGDFLGIAGHTGSGKSTLLRMLAGLTEATSGNISIKGISMDSKDGKKVVREMLGIVMQYPEKQLFAETVYDDCAFGPKNLGLPDTEVNERVRAALSMVGLEEDILDKSPFQLSGGQQRRVAIAGVLAMDPKILILDEPTAGLDPAGCRSLMALIKRMHDDHGVTIVMVSHNMDNIANICNKVLVLNKGSKFLEGSPLQVFSDRQDLREIGLGLPSSLRIAYKLGIRGFKSVPNMGQLAKCIKGGISAECTREPWDTTASEKQRKQSSDAVEIFIPETASVERRAHE